MLLDFSIDYSLFWSLGGLYMLFFGAIWGVSYALKVARTS